MPAAGPDQVSGHDLMRAVRARHPRLRDALVADAEVTAAFRGERHDFDGAADTLFNIIRLAWSSDAFLAQSFYRVKARLQALGVPLLPRLAHKSAMLIAQVSIGDPVIVQPGVYVIHGQVVLDGIVEVGSGTVLGPWITIGLKAGNVQGATIENDVHVGTGAKVIGPVRIGAGARIGANAVVVSDVEARTTVGGVPARPVGS
jgi:serine O-acetyltransferase